MTFDENERQRTSRTKQADYKELCVITAEERIDHKGIGPKAHRRAAKSKRAKIACAGLSKQFKMRKQTLFSTGSNSRGQTAHGNTEAKQVFTRVPVTAHIKHIASGGEHVIIVTGNFKLKNLLY